MGYTLITPPSGEPITRAEAKLHLRVDDISGSHPDDTLIDALIVAARQYAEQQTRRSLMTQTWRYTSDAFPREFWLEKGPVSAISSIVYLDTAGVSQTLATSEYTSDLTGEMARVAPQFGKVWPPTLPQIGAATVTFIAGYGNAAAVPQGIKQWMLLRIGSLYEARAELGWTDFKSMPPMFIDSLLDPYRIEAA